MAFTWCGIIEWMKVIIVFSGSGVSSILYCARCIRIDNWCIFRGGGYLALYLTSISQFMASRQLLKFSAVAPNSMPSVHRYVSWQRPLFWFGK